MKHFAVLSIVAICLAAAVATPPKGKSGSKKASGPHYKAYGLFTGPRRGEFRGTEGQQHDLIPVLTFKMNSAKKSHSTMSMTIQSLDGQVFENALHNHEVLPRVDIQVMGPNVQGVIKVQQTISLGNVTVGNVKIRFSGGKEVEDLTLAYQTEDIEQGH